MLLTSQTTLVDNDYYSVVDTDEPSICEDVEGISLQDETAGDNKEEYKAITDYNLLLRSIIYPKFTTDFEKVAYLHFVLSQVIHLLLGHFNFSNFFWSTICILFCKPQKI